MNNLNDAFLEEFKRLDNLCRDIYQAEKGITSYIDDMRSVPQYESRRVPGWDTDLKRLIDLRNLRNRLSHEVGTLNESQCTQSDIDWLSAFRQRIFNQTDPISLLRKSAPKKAGQPKTTVTPQQPIVYPQQSNPAFRRREIHSHPSGCLIASTVFATALLGILLAAIIVRFLS